MVDTQKIREALTSLKEENKKNFEQTVECVFTLKDIDLKKQPVDFFVTLNHERGRKQKICALVGGELSDEAQKVFDKTILHGEFGKLSQNDLKQVAQEYDFFVAQANIMKDVASTFGRVLGPRGKMPNPKAGCVVPPKAALQPVYNRLQKTVRIQAKGPMIQLAVGKEQQKVEDVLDNIQHVYDALVHNLPLHINNIRMVYMKLTMSPPIKVM